MALLGDLTGVGQLADSAARIIGLFKADPNVKAAGELKLQEDALQGEIQAVLMQLQINIEEAKSQSVFVAGWRPGIGWVCGAALAYTYVIQPFLVFFLIAVHRVFDPKLLPAIDSAELMTLLLSLLGLAGMRSFDKSKGTDSGH